MLRVIIKTGWFAMFVGSMALPLYAADCLDPSPNLLAGKGLFTPSVFRDLTPSEHRMVRQMLQSLDGNWTGQGFNIQCPSTDGVVGKKEYKYKIRGKVRTDYDGNLSLEMELEDRQNRSTHQEEFRLYLKDMRLRMTDDTIGDVEIVTLSPNQITFIRRVSLYGLSIRKKKRREYVFSLLIDADGFSLHRDSYVGGKMNSKRRWRFEGKW